MFQHQHANRRRRSPPRALTPTSPREVLPDRRTRVIWDGSRSSFRKQRPELERALRASVGAFEVATGAWALPAEETPLPVMTDITMIPNPAYDHDAPPPPAGNMMADPANAGAMIAIPLLIDNPAAPAAADRQAILDELRLVHDYEMKKVRKERERYDAGKAAFFKIVAVVVGPNGIAAVEAELQSGDPFATWSRWVNIGQPVEVSSRAGLTEKWMKVVWERDEPMDGLVSRLDQIYRLLLNYPGAVDIDEDMKKTRFFGCVAGEPYRGWKYEAKISAITNPLDPTAHFTYDQSKTIMINEEQAIRANGGYHRHDGGGKERTYARAVSENDPPTEPTKGAPAEQARVTCFVPKCGGNHLA